MNSGQYPTPISDLIPIQKGVTFRQLLSSNTDIRGCLVFGEVKRAIPGKQEAAFRVSVKAGESAVRFNGIVGTNKGIGIKVGDFVDIESAGIINARVEAVTSRAIILDQQSPIHLTETYISVKSPTLANFTFIPKSDFFKITTTEAGAKSSSSLKIGANLLSVGSGNQIVFNQYKTLKTSRIPVPVKKTLLVFNRNGVATEVNLSSDIVPGATAINTFPLPESLPQGCTAIIGSSTAILRDNCQRKDRVIKVRALKIPIPRNTILNFGYKDVTGWRQTGSVIVAESVLENSLTIPIFPYVGQIPIPANSIAYFGNLPIQSFYIVLDPIETENLNSGDDYGCDIIATSIDGVSKKIAQISKISFLDSWSDLA